MEVFIAFVILGIAVVLMIYIFSGWESHREIRDKGGIRNKFNQLFSFFYNLPNSIITLETKSLVIFKISDYRCTKNIRLNYYMDKLNIICKVTYYDDTAFNNGEKFRWTLYQGSDEQNIIAQIRNTLASLP